MKASEGGDFSDTAFIHNFDEARKHGFIRGASK
jgi:lysozyme